MLKLAVTGATGRMGQTLIQDILSRSDCELKGAILRKEHPLVGQAVSLYFNNQNVDILFEDDILSAFQKADLIIDFTRPEATHVYLEAAVTLKKPILIGTTGLSTEDHHQLKQASLTIPVLYAPNTTFGIAVLRKLITQAAKILGSDYDISLLEMHHRQKVDAPSGTTLQLANDLQSVTGYPLHTLQDKEKRPDQTIEIAALRGGGVLGDHDVIFSGENEILTLQHRVLNRRVFAEGALKAALWLSTQSAGYYTMQDLFDIS